LLVAHRSAAEAATAAYVYGFHDEFREAKELWHRSFPVTVRLAPEYFPLPYVSVYPLVITGFGRA
jgi:hypothetical protein